MKKILSTIIAVAALLTLATSCNKDNKVGKYDFLIATFTEVEDESRSSAIKEIINSDSYFSEIHSYTATFNEAVTQAAQEFDEHIKKLDTGSIEAQLMLGEGVKISLWSMDPGNCWLTYIITPEGASSEGN